MNKFLFLTLILLIIACHSKRKVLNKYAYNHNSFYGTYIDKQGRTLIFDCDTTHNKDYETKRRFEGYCTEHCPDFRNPADCYVACVPFSGIYRRKNDTLWLSTNSQQGRFDSLRGSTGLVIDQAIKAADSIFLTVRLSQALPIIGELNVSISTFSTEPESDSVYRKYKHPLLDTITGWFCWRDYNFKIDSLENKKQIDFYFAIPKLKNHKFKGLQITYLTDYPPAWTEWTDNGIESSPVDFYSSDETFEYSLPKNSVINAVEVMMYPSFFPSWHNEMFLIDSCGDLYGDLLYNRGEKYEKITKRSTYYKQH